MSDLQPKWDLQPMVDVWPTPFLRKIVIKNLEKFFPTQVWVEVKEPMITWWFTEPRRSSKQPAEHQKSGFRWKKTLICPSFQFMGWLIRILLLADCKPYNGKSSKAPITRQFQKHDRALLKPGTLTIMERFSMLSDPLSYVGSAQARKKISSFVALLMDSIFFGGASGMRPNSEMWQDGFTTYLLPLMASISTLTVNGNGMVKLYAAREFKMSCFQKEKQR